MLLAPDAFGIEKRVEVFGFRLVTGEIFRRLICNNGTASSAQNFDLQCASLHVLVMTEMNEAVKSKGKAKHVESKSGERTNGQTKKTPTNRPTKHTLRCFFFFI